MSFSSEDLLERKKEKRGKERRKKERKEREKARKKVFLALQNTL